MEDKKPPLEWPMQGNVEFNDYSVRYREGLDLVLKDITLKVKGGEKVWGGNAEMIYLSVQNNGSVRCSTQLCVFLRRSVSWVVLGLASPR